MKTKKIKSKRKPLDLPGLKRKLTTVFNRFIRLRDCLATSGEVTHGFCFTCGSHKSFQDLDAGHFVAGKNMSVRFLEDNVHAQCKRCNYFEGGNLIPYTLKMVQIYGQARVDELQKLKRQSKKFTRFELEELIKTYKQKVISLEGKRKI